MRFGVVPHAVRIDDEGAPPERVWLCICMCGPQLSQESDPGVPALASPKEIASPAPIAKMILQLNPYIEGTPLARTNIRRAFRN
jgi:hypothetical protein